MKNVITYAMKGVSATVHDHLDKLLENSSDSIESSVKQERSYYRFEPSFDENIEMDAIEKQDIQRLQDLGKKLVEDKKSDLDRLVKHLK